MASNLSLLLLRRGPSAAASAAMRRRAAPTMMKRAVSTSVIGTPTATDATKRWTGRPLVATSDLSTRNFTSTATLSDLPSHEIMGMPALSPTMDSGTISKWNVSVGSTFSAGDSLAVIETDKASMDFEAQDDGAVAAILVEENGGEVAVGVPIIVTVEEAADVAAFEGFVLEAIAAEESGDGGAAVEAVAEAAATPAATSETGAARPSGRPSLMKFLGKDGWAARRSGTDAPAAATAPTATATIAAPTAAATIAIAAPTATAPAVPETTTMSPGQTFRDEPNSGMRKVIARRLAESKSTVPHYYASVECRLDEIMKMRKKLKDEFDVKVSVNDIIIKASAMALRDVPEVNGTFDPKTSAVRSYDNIDISIAVATPTGLITPIVPATDSLALTEISAKVRDLATRARDGKLAPEEYQGGTFCISNLGMFGIDEFSAVINPPQAAILAVGGGTRRVVPSPYDPSKGLDEQEKPVIRTIMTARLSVDRRVVDEATAGLFLACLKEYLDQPKLLML